MVPPGRHTRTSSSAIAMNSSTTPSTKLNWGIQIGITIWPLADRQIKELASKVKGILVHELNYGQYVLEVERVVAGQVPVALYAKYDNEPATPAQLLAEIKKAMA